MKRTSVAGRSYLLHAPHGHHTRCGRPVERVNCEPTIAAFVVDIDRESGHCSSCTRLIRADIAKGGDIAFQHRKFGAAQ